LTSHRRPVIIAAAAAGILGALYFVPNASASAQHTTNTPASVTTRTTQKSAAATAATARQELADTGAVDTTPYLIGGTAFLGIGAGLVVNASRRARYEM
jgi:hypothetical protein